MTSELVEGVCFDLAPFDLFSLLVHCLPENYADFYKVQIVGLKCHVIRNSLRLCCVDQSGTSIQILPEPRDTFFIKLRL